MAGWARLGWAGLLLVAGSWPLSTAWSGSTTAMVFVAAALIPLLLIGVSSASRVAPPLVAVVVLIAALFAAYRWAVPDGMAPAAGLRDSVARLLTEENPAPPTPALLAPGVLLVIVVSLWVGIRAVAPHRRGAGLVAAPAGAVLLYLAAALLTAGRADPAGLVAVAVVVLAAAGWLLLDPPRPARVVAPRLALSAATVAVVAFTTGVVWTVGPGFEPRRLLDPPGRTVAEPSPLPRIGAWLQQGDRELLRASVDDGAPLRLVVLSDYTGATWSATATYRRPGTVPDNRLPVAHESTVRAQVEITTLDGPWLPTPGRATETSLSDVDIEPDAGSLAVRDGTIRPGLTYTVSAVLDTPRVDEVAAAGVPTDSADVRRLLDLPRLPPVFADYARQVTFGASTPFEQAVALEYAVRDGGRVDATAPAGSSYARLDTFLFRRPGSEPGAHTGTSEQFASAFAVLARAVGLPTRIVVGFTAGAPGPDGTRIMRGRDVHAWPEVYFTGLGWYGFAPTPATTDPAGTDEQAKLTVLDRMGNQAGRANPVRPTTTAPVAPTSPPAVAQRPNPAPSSWPGRAILGVGTAALIVVVVIMAARSARRSRHRRAGDRGAWSEVVDLLVLAGRAPAWSRPAPDVANDLAAFAPVVGPTHPARVIAAAADRAAFAPAPGSSDGSTWLAVREVRRAVAATVPRWRRWIWPVDPRPLLRRPRRPPRRTVSGG